MSQPPSDDSPPNYPPWAAINGVETSRRAVTHPRAWSTPLKPSVYPMVLRGLRNGGSPGPRHGETVLGVPADFLIDPTGRVLALRYGRHANDQWTADELIALALPARRIRPTNPSGCGRRRD
jgi:hypothetical protein